MLQKLEGHLTEQYNESQEKFLIWKKQAQETISSCQAVSGEPHEIASKIASLEDIFADQEKVSKWLEELEEHCKADVEGSAIQEQLNKHQQEFKGVNREANHFLKILKDAAVYVKTLEENRLELTKWLNEISKSINDFQDESESIEKANDKLEKLRALRIRDRHRAGPPGHLKHPVS